MPTALITGATGFIGANLVRRLLKLGWPVHILIRPGSKLTLLEDVCNRVVLHEHDGTTKGLVSIVKSAAPEIVFHLASLFLASHKTEEVEPLIESNVLFPTQLLEAMALNGVGKIINTGTCWQHYENQEFNPVNLYASTKQAYESIIKYYSEAFSIRSTTLVLFDTYGLGDPRSKLINLLWRTALNSNTLEMSPGEQMIDIVHVEDVVDAFIEAADQMGDGKKLLLRYGISSGKPLQLKEIVKLFEDSTGLVLPIKWGGRPYRFREVMQSWTNYETLPNWSPKRSFKVEILKMRPNGDNASGSIK